MPTKERAARERVRDAMHDIAFEVAEHTAGGDMIEVERREHGAVEFIGLPRMIRCDCGLAMTTLPQFHSRYGVLPIWVCGVCNLDFIVELAERIGREAIARAAQKPKNGS